MALIEETLFGVRDKVAIAIDRIRALCTGDVVVAFSGGKDSQVVLDLVRRSGIDHTDQMSVTGIDPPELTLFVKRQYPEVTRLPPKKTMFQLIEHKGSPPTLFARYCCEHLKERGNEGKTVVTGIRWEESMRRSKRKMTDTCTKGVGKRYVHPIIDWTADDVWEYIRSHRTPYCKLYDEGYNRIGCIGCPSAPTRAMDLERYPNTKAAYLKAFGRMLENNKRKGIGNRSGWTDAQSVMDWWLAKKKRRDDTQIEMFYDN